MRELPRGTVTFLFTDVEGSTRLLHELGSVYAEALAEHRRLLRDASVRHGGVEVDTQGDAFFVAFARASDALAAAQAGRRALAQPSNRLLQGRIKVRMGLHTGEPTVTEEGYVGADVHTAARIMSAGHGGQILVSEQTARLAGDAPLVDLGLHRLKDVGEIRIHQLGEGGFPPLASLNATNLPSRASLVGRKKELADVRRLLKRDGARLVTVTGPGGIGKTSVAIAAASELVDEFPHGVWLVELASVREPELVPATIAGTLGARGDLAHHIGDRRLLLVLDNLEHVIVFAADVGELLERCPRLAVLATSRENLRVARERAYPLRPLAESPAVELFRTRADEAQPGFDGDYAEIAEICARLDNVPLAIELAAARVRTLTPGRLLERLEQRLPLLVSRSRDAPERQRTLRATIEWSYELLSPAEQELFARLAVFSGGFTLEAAEAVVDADVDTLESLIDKSLVSARDGRLLVLETIREYALERLRESGHAEELGRAHAGFFLVLAESAHLAADDDGEQLHGLVIPERDNMRAALAWALDRDRALGLRLVVALENFWAASAPEEGRSWASALLDAADGVPDVVRARAVRVHGGMCNVTGDRDSAERLFREALGLCLSAGDERGVAILLHRLASVATARGEWSAARALAEQSLAGHRAAGFRKGEAQALTTLAHAARAEADPERALALLDESARIAAEIGFRWWHAGAEAGAAALELTLGRGAAALERARRALSTSTAIGDRAGMTYELAVLAEICASDGRRRDAGVLWGAVEAERERVPSRTWLHGEIEPDRVLAHADAEFQRGRERGRRLALEQAAQEALDA